MYKIGDFSQLAQISVRMLRHYDKLGLLKPGHVDQWTGYRYYTLDQFGRELDHYSKRPPGDATIEILVPIKKI